ncbi:predicted protein, partial [Postia placenta Mad-698-R]
VKGKAQPSFASYLIETQEQLGLSNDELAYLAGALFSAGSDTTAAALGVMTMAAACYPDAQARVQSQLDEVVGYDRVPTFEDESGGLSLLEVSSLTPPSVLTQFHYLNRQNNYVIPAGTQIIGNHWAIARDPEFFPDPEAFKPERWLNEHGRIRDDIKFPNFGFGRRSLFINTALALWAFNISQDPARPIDILAFTDAANAHPLPFALRFVPRVKGLEAMLGDV